VPVATMGNQTRTRNNVICKTESVTASRAQTLVRAATRRDESAAGEIWPKKMTWQPVGDQRKGIFYVDEMSRAEEDQGQAVERAGNAKAIAADHKAKVVTVPVSGKPCIEDQGSGQNDRKREHGPASCKSGYEKKVWNPNNNNQRKKAATSRRAAAPGVRQASRPPPAAREINEARDTSRPPAETFGAGFQTGTKSRRTRPMIPRPIVVTAKIARPVLAVRIALLQKGYVSQTVSYRKAGSNLFDESSTTQYRA
jgi:hypothetical protein